SETYKTTLSSFMKFREGEDLALVNISSDLMMDYEAYLKERNISMNSISFYMRILRAVYNRAVDNELIEQRFPFKKVYTGVDKTVKRALPLKYIKKIKALDLSLKPDLMFARDMFLFSFYTRGMSFIDMAYLREKDLQNGIITYRRRKTGQQLHIKWEPCMQEIMDQYPRFDTDYLLPIIQNKSIAARAQYTNMLRLINNKLKKIGEIIGVANTLTLYVARHSWASVAKNSNIPTSVISESMGHNSEATTQIYLASLDTSIVDKANCLIIKLLISQ
ncbi:MAG: site-specific integrase, partial [Rikenellaceae bacterium]